MFLSNDDYSLFLQADILDENKRLISAVDYYFLQEDGSRFKVSFQFVFLHQTLPQSVMQIRQFFCLVCSVKDYHHQQLDLFIISTMVDSYSPG